MSEEVGTGKEDLLVLEAISGGRVGRTSRRRRPSGSAATARSIEESALGDGMIDAAMGAISRAAGVEARLVSFHVSAVTGGTDALGDVVVQVDVDGRRVTGRGVATDVVEASARAYLAALNRALLVQAKDDAQTNEVTP